MTCKDVLAQFRNAETNGIVYIRQLYFLPLLHVYVQKSSITCTISYMTCVCKIRLRMQTNIQIFVKYFNIKTNIFLLTLEK